MELEELLKVGAELQVSGKLLEAEAVYKSAPNYELNPSILNNMAILYLAKGEHWEAEKFAWYALQIAKDERIIKTLVRILFETNQITFLKNLIQNHLDTEIKKVAIEYYNSLKSQPRKSKNDDESINSNNIPIRVKSHIANLANSGVKIFSDDSIKKIRKIAKQDRTNAEHYYSFIGEIYFKRKLYDAAERSYRISLGFNKENTSSLSGLGLISILNRKFNDARQYLAKVYDQGKADWSCISNLATVERHLLKYTEAIKLYKEALAIVPENAEVISNLSVVLKISGQEKEASWCNSKAFIIDENSIVVATNYATELGAKFRYGEAIKILQSLRARVSDKVILNNLGHLYQHYGDHRAATKMFDAAIEIDPHYIDAHSNKLFTSNYDPDLPADMLFARYIEFSRVLTKLAVPKTQVQIKKNYSNQFRGVIGFVSGDFNTHPVRNFLQPIIEGFLLSEYKIIAYYNNSISDNSTDWFRGKFHSFNQINFLDDDQIARKIEADQVDLLIDLSGHTAHNRLSLFKLKPAKSSATWIGYNYTTGLSEIDYFFTDDYQVIPGTEAYYAEIPFSLGKTAYCFQPNYTSTSYLDKNNILPYKKRKYITFGSFTRGIRLNDKVISTWSSILNSNVGSRLRLDSRSFADISVCRFFSNKFKKYGVNPNRIDFCFTPIYESLPEVDIVLDCFPHNSGTTLYECLYLNRPFITLSGQLSIGRLGGSILNTLQINELINSNESQYMKSAIDLAGDTERLDRYSRELRERLLESPIMNKTLFFKDFLKKIDLIISEDRKYIN